GSSTLAGGTFIDGGLTAFTAGSQVSIAGIVALKSSTAGPTLRLDGTTSWSGGRVDVLNAGGVEGAGAVQVTGGVRLESSLGGGSGTEGRIAFVVLATGVTEVSGSLSVAGEVEDDGVLRVLDGGSLVQTTELAPPADSSGVFEARGSGVMALSSVSMAAGSS